MLTLTLVRHAKAEPLSRGEDIDRALTSKGTEDARRLGAHLRVAGVVPAIAFVSKAKRTTQTFVALAREMGSTVPVRFESRLFTATPTDLRHFIRHLPTSLEQVMIIGHNPAIMDAALDLVGQGDLAEVARMRGRFPPCATAVMTFDAEAWSQVTTGSGRLDAFILPEDLQPEG
jgi:phosphohistidine phosphatase